MQIDSYNLVEILFKVIFVFVGLNVIVNLILLYTRRQRINKLLSLYWPMVLVMYVIQGHFQTGHLPVVLAFSVTMGASLIIGIIGTEAVGRQFPLKKYLLFYLPFYPLTIWLDSLDLTFTLIAMPFAIAIALPTMHAFICLNIIDYKKSTLLQKVLGIVCFFNAIHSINFALFRMEPNAQLWGWLVSYILCDLLAILLPSIALEKNSLTENERLQNLVDHRTEELNKSLKTNESFFKVLIHDISTPLMVMKNFLHVLKGNPENKDFLIDRMNRAQMTMEDIITQMKNSYLVKSQSKVQLSPVDVAECLQEISFIFEQPLKQKNITLKIHNQLESKTCVLADQISLTHSVLSNLISNGIKFNSPNSEIEITAKKNDKFIVFEILDQGPGIPQNIIQDILDNKELSSSQGTLGEIGSGLGLSIVKSFVDSYGGKLEFESKDSVGTLIRITLALNQDLR